MVSTNSSSESKLRYLRDDIKEDTAFLKNLMLTGVLTGLP